MKVRSTVAASRTRANWPTPRVLVHRRVCAALALAWVCTGGTLALPEYARAADAPTSATAPTPAPANTSVAPVSAPENNAAAAAKPGASVSAASATSAVSAVAPASAAAPTQPPPYSASPTIRYGSFATFRNLIPSPVLEAQATAEFDEIVLGADHAKSLYPATDERVKRVRSITEALIPYSLKWNERAKNWKWDIAVVRSPDIRMYCLPGGKIVVYSGLLDRVRLNDNELGMLIGHEIAHALREHARERLGEQQAAQFGNGSIPQLFGLADLGSFPLGIGSQLLQMKYESTDETEADVIGSEIASRAGFDPRAAITLWDKLSAATRSNRDQGFIYVHPYTPARRADIMKRLPDMLQLYAKATGKPVEALPDYAGIGHPQRPQASN